MDTTEAPKNVPPTSSVQTYRSSAPASITTTMAPQLQSLMNRLSSGTRVVQNIMEVSSHVVEVTVAEILAAVAANPAHPVAEVFANAVRGLPGSHKVYVEQPDIHALITNGTVVINDSKTADGVATRTKYVV